MMHWKSTLAALAAAALAGCATLDAWQREDLASADPAVRDCARWYRDVDEAVDAAGVRDAQAHRVRGFPYLRVDRFTASLADRAAAGGGAFDAWLARAERLDAEARGHELRNLAREDASFGVKCAPILAHADFARPDTRAELLARVKVPDDYAGWQRAIGFYPLTRIPFASGVQRWHEEALAMFRRAQAEPPRGWRRFGPRPGTAPSRQAVAAILARSQDPLGVPEPRGADAEALFAAFAPVFEVESDAAYDRPGRLRRASGTVQVDPSLSVVYRRFAHTRYGEKSLLQLVYTIWFPERPAQGAFDMLAGQLDGIVLRVTLSPDGEAILYDSMHPCGCYHMFFPTPRAEPRPAPEPRDEWAFVPRVLPAIAAGQHIVVRVASRTHYLVDVAPDAGGTAHEYAFSEEDELRALADETGRTRSLYGPDGLVAGTERSERLLFWPMGVPSAGTMRQWGHHATAFLGRRHFDDADLIERRFRIVP
jgi:hypothetical protein